MGEDNFLVRNKFVCVLDGVGGWSSKGIDSGLMTKELVKYIASNYDASQCRNLHELLDESVKLVKAKGSTTCVMAEVYPTCF